MSVRPDGADASRQVWREEERWVIDIGKKFIRAASAQDPQVETARPGDRVVIPVRIGEDYEAEALSTRLRERGVEVELRHESNALPAGGALSDGSVAGEDGMAASNPAGDLYGAQMDQMDPVRLFTDYMGSIDISALMDNGAASANGSKAKSGKGGKDQLSDAARLALHNAVLTEGCSTIERLTSSSTLAGHQLGDSARGAKLCALKLDRMTLRNFGPYGGDPVHYPLSQRGLVLIRGQSTDRTGADSNGAGKVMRSNVTCASVLSL